MKWRLELVSEAEWGDLMSKALKVRAMAAAKGWTKEPTWSK
ncbi:MAG TPA: hypothetical protein PLK80_10865 [bacterium]|nr:hypothetical protein [bacterium]